MRCFRSSVSVYEQVCARLDAEYGYPNAATKTERALPLVSELPVDSAGRVYLAVSEEFCEYTLPAAMLSDLIAGGAVEEITEAEYLASLPNGPPG